ncbi:MAG: hypothetical protein ACFFC7_08440 [Candidatus Hermodarchaeota archaeon]
MKPVIGAIVFNDIQDAKKYLIDYWTSLPATKQIQEPIEVTEKLLKQEIRSAIVDILREGIVDEIDEVEVEYQDKRRHALTAQELREHIKKRLETQIKLSTVYFHLQKLQEHGYIQIVTIIKQGRSNIAYYGRTAKLFLFPNKMDSLKEIHFINKLSKLISELNPNQEEEQTIELVKKLQKLNIEMEQTINKWIEKNEEFINKISIDVKALFYFLAILGRTSPRIAKIQAEITKLLKLEF